MNNEAAVINILGLNLYTYGLFLSIACALAAVLLIFTTRNIKQYRNTASITCLFSPILGLISARLIFVLFEVNFSPFLTFKNTLNLKIGGLSMFGALFGATLGAMLAAKASKIKISAWLDLITPALFIFIAVARLGEAYTTLGISRPLVTDAIKSTFLAFQDEYDAYLRTYLLESFTALFLFISSTSYIKKNTKPGHTFIYGSLLFGITQTLFESLRFDAHIRFSFVGLQQMLSIVMFSSILIYLSIYHLRQKKEKRLAILTLCLLPLVLAAILGLEFMIDRSDLSKWLSYALYTITLAIPAVLGLFLLKKDRV